MRIRVLVLLVVGACDSDPKPVAVVAPLPEPVPVECYQLEYEVPDLEEPYTPAVLVPEDPTPVRPSPKKRKRVPRPRTVPEECPASDPLCGIRR